MTIDELLGRLNGVRQTGPDRYVARCPAHEDRNPSLSIRVTDGRILLWDFAGCQVGEIIAALGLSLGDLFERPLTHHASPSKSHIPARDLVVAMAEEATVAAIIVADLIEIGSASELAWSRLALAARRLGRARDHTNAR